MKWLLALCLSCVVCLFAFGDVRTNIRYDGEIEESKSVEGTIDGKTAKIAIVNGFIPNEISEEAEKVKGLESRTFIFDKKTVYRKGMKIEFISNAKKRILNTSESTTDSNDKTTVGPTMNLKMFILKDTEAKEEKAIVPVTDGLLI